MNKEINLLKENARRLKRFFRNYNPVVGDSDDPDRVLLNVQGIRKAYIPAPMMEIPLLKNLSKAASLSKFIRSSFFKNHFHSVSQLFREIHKTRLKFDFPYWISHYYPFPIDYKTNRSLIRVLQQSRSTGQPLRLLIRKYEGLDIFNIINLFLIWSGFYSNSRLNLMSVYPSVIYCKKVKDFFLDWSGKISDETLRFEKSDFSSSLRYPREDSRLWFIPASLPDNARGRSFSLLYLSDIHLWKNSKISPANRIISATFPVVSCVPETAIILESGPCKRNSFFINEWNDAVKKLSPFKTLVTPWHENISHFTRFDYNHERIGFFNQLWRKRHRKSLSHFPNASPRQLLSLWNIGLPLEVLHWYASESSFFKSRSRFLNAFPTPPL